MAKPLTAEDIADAIAYRVARGWRDLGGGRMERKGTIVDVPRLLAAVTGRKLPAELKVFTGATP